MSIRFDNAADTLYRTANVPSGNFTVSMMVRGVAGAGSYRSFLTIGDVSNDYNWWGVNSGNAFTIWDEASERAAGGTFSLNTWYHIVITLSGTTASLYYRAWGAASYASISGTVLAAARPQIAYGNDVFDEHLNGRMAVVKLWDGAVLTSGEFSRERLSVQPLRFTNLSAWYPMFPGAGERNRDYGQNGRDLTVGGTLTDEAGPPIPWNRPSSPMLYVVGGGQTYNFAATLAAASATPTTNVLNVLRAMTAQAAFVSSTPTTNVLNVLRAMAAQATAASLTPDTATLTISGLIELAATLAAQSATPDVAAINVLRALAGVAGSASATPDTATLAVLRPLLASSLAQSSSSNVAALNILRPMIAAALAASFTPLVRNTLGQFALRFYGNGTGNIDRARIPLDPGGSSSAADVGAGDFTYECRINCLYANNTSGPGIGDARNSNIFWDRDIWGHARGWVAGVTRVSGPKLVVCFGIAGASQTWTTIYGSIDIGDGAWHHVAIVRQQSTGAVELYVDGALDASGTYTTGDLSYPDGYDPGQGQNNPYLVLGAEKHDAGAQYPSYDGKMEELRISDNRRYTTGFTPETQPFTADANTRGLYHMDDGYGTVMIDVATVSGAPTEGELLVGGTPSGPEWIASDAWAILLQAILAAVSGTPTTSSLAVTRAMAASLGAQSESPTISVLSVLRAMAAQATAASVTPDVVVVSILRALLVSADAQSATPAASSLAVLRAFSAVALAGSGTPDAASINVLRAMNAVALAQSFAADDATLSIAGLIELAATLAAISNTPATSQIAVLRPMAASLLAQSLTPDDAELSVAGIIALAALLSAVSGTSPASVLAVLRPMAAGAAAASQTPDTSQIAIMRSLSAILASSSATPAAALIVSRALSAQALAQSATPDAILSVQRLFAAIAAGQSVTPDTVTLLVVIAQGLARASFSGRKPGAAFTGRKPGVDFDD